MGKVLKRQLLVLRTLVRCAMSVSDIIQFLCDSNDYRRKESQRVIQRDLKVLRTDYNVVQVGTDERGAPVYGVAFERPSKPDKSAEKQASIYTESFWA